MLFTGREELLTQLATSLHTGQPTAISQPPKDSQPQAISGLGGIGKTQLALEYAYRYRSEYQAVLWAQADTKETLTSSYLELATLLEFTREGCTGKCSSDCGNEEMVTTVNRISPDFG